MKEFVYKNKKQADGFGKLHWNFTIPILMGEPCHTGSNEFA